MSEVIKTRFDMVLPIIPTPQMRARHMTGVSKSGKTFAATYTPKKQKEEAGSIMQLLAQYVPEKPMEGYINIVISAFLPIPQSKPQWWKEAASKEYIKPTGKPDVDNLAKNILDCMTKMSFWHDDNQITRLLINKVYSEKPMWVIGITEYEQITTKKQYEDLYHAK